MNPKLTLTALGGVALLSGCYYVGYPAYPAYPSYPVVGAAYTQREFTVGTQEASSAVVSSYTTTPVAAQYPVAQPPVTYATYPAYYPAYPYPAYPAYPYAAYPGYYGYGYPSISVGFGYWGGGGCCWGGHGWHGGGGGWHGGGGGNWHGGGSGHSH
jgi:hypothetical protein